MSNTSADHKGKMFEKRVANLFALLGYRVQRDVLVAGRQIDLLLEDRSGPLTRSYIAECKDQAAPVTTAQYDAFLGRLRTAKHEISPKIRGIIVSSVGFVKEAKAQSASDDVELVSISELETSVIDFRQYVSELVQRLESDPTLTHFVEPTVKREHLSIPESAYSQFEEWLLDPSLNQLTLLGDYGAGKSTLLKQLTLTMARRYQQGVLEEGARGRIPIFIDLRDYTQAISLKQIILDFLDANSIKLASYSAFEYVSREGQLLLILDGFDEMASRGNYQVTLRNFRALNKEAIGRAKIILSCRTHYFTTYQDVQKFHGQMLPPKSYTDLYREIAARRNFLITYLMEFETKQVEQYLQRRCGEHWYKVQSFIESTYNLLELSRKPVLLDLIVLSQDKIKSQNAEVNPGVLYQIYTDIWLSRNDWSTVIDATTKSALLERFAYLASRNPDFQLHYKAIPEMIKSWNKDIKDEDASEIDRELRTASFLVNDHAGNYRFSHKSFQEFFYAKFLLSEAKASNSSCWGEGFFRTEIYRFIRDLLVLMRDAMQDVIANLTAWAQNPDLNEYCQANAIKCLGGSPGNEITRALLRALRNSDSEITRRSAATALSYYKMDEVVETLIDVSTHNDSLYVRTNCLLALGKLNDEAGIDYLISILTGKNDQVKSQGLVREVLYVAAKNFDDDGPVKEFIRTAPIASSHRNTLEACLDLCAHRWSVEAEDYCNRLLESTDNPTLMAKAFSIISPEQRILFLPKIFGLIESYLKSKGSIYLITSLKGTKHPTVETQLCFLLEKYYSKPYLEHVEAILKVLSVDYPQTIQSNAPKWLQFNQPFTLRLQILEEYLKNRPQDGLDILASFLSPKERPRVKIRVLGLIYDYYTESIPDIVEKLWTLEPATAVKRHGLELLRKVNWNKALSLIIESGLKDSRTGTRVVVCSVLGAEPSREATDVLLGALQHDNSNWVRLQALRSLCAPGRDVSKAEIVLATADEVDRDVLNLRKELINE